MDKVKCFRSCFGHRSVFAGVVRPFLFCDLQLDLAVFFFKVKNALLAKPVDLTVLRAPVIVGDIDQLFGGVRVDPDSKLHGFPRHSSGPLS